MCQKLRERFFDLDVWFKTMRKMLTGEGGRHRRTLRGRRKEAGAAGLVPGGTGRVRGQQLRLLLFDAEEFHGDDRHLQ